MPPLTYSRQAGQLALLRDENDRSSAAKSPRLAEEVKEAHKLPGSLTVIWGMVLTTSYSTPGEAFGGLDTEGADGL